MLKRILEPEVMDSEDEAITYDDMDHREVNEQFVQDLLAFGQASGIEIQGEVLDLGTGTARIPILLCDATEEVRVFGIDLSIEMLEVARLNVELSPHLERVMLGHSDAKSLELDDNRFDVVMSNSIVHHIPDPASTFAEAVRICRPGGVLFFRDLLRPNSDEEVNKLVETYAGGEANEARKMFDDSLRAAFTLEEVKAFVSNVGIDAETVHATSDRHWTWRAIK